MARPGKLTEELQNTIVLLLRNGSYRETACAFAGISRRTYYNWWNRGNAEKSGKYRRFLEAVEAAIAKAEIADLKIIDQAAKKKLEGRRLETRTPFPQTLGKRAISSAYRGEWRAGASKSRLHGCAQLGLRQGETHGRGA